jgi:hypothetical protein
MKALLFFFPPGSRQELGRGTLALLFAHSIRGWTNRGFFAKPLINTTDTVDGHASYAM